jgi:hypothetical protein
LLPFTYYVDQHDTSSRGESRSRMWQLNKKKESKEVNEANVGVRCDVKIAGNDNRSTAIIDVYIS